MGETVLEELLADEVSLPGCTKPNTRLVQTVVRPG
jgi:hypothetical protein